ncbi:restriction endonuclease subunit S [Bacteroides fragilis]|uniref:restriction endonuclease subunit S n=1 Tax=Bacteroides fragilis TaxID=817 RepID=UPI0039B5AD33
MVSLQDIATINPKSDPLQNTFIYIDLEAVEKGELRKIQEIMREEAPSRAQRVIDNNDILFQCVRPYQKNNYIHRILNTSNQQWVASTGYAQIRTTELPNYIYHLLNTDEFNRKVMVRCTGSSYPAINSEDLATIHLYYTPDKKEQLKISRLLDLLDKRIATQNKIIEDLKKLKSAISKHLFARKDLLETTICLSNIATLKNGYAFQSGKYNALGKWKILTITTVSGERYINDEDYNCIINLPNDIQDHQVLKEGDILISLTGNVGRVSLCKDGDYLLNQRVGLLQLAKNVNQEFLYQILSSQRFENSMIACGQGAAQMNIGKGDVESYVLPYSSNVNNILLVAKILHSYDEYIINEQRKLTLLTMQKQYFLAQMFI